jgi:hypothetical protein
MESRGFQKIWDCGSLKYEIEELSYQKVKLLTE